MCVFFCKRKTAYEMGISDWSSDVCASDLMRLRRRQRRVGGSGQHLEGRERSDGGERAAGKDDRLAPDPVAEPAEEDEKGRAEREGERDHYVRGRAVDLQRLFEKEQRIE